MWPASQNTSADWPRRAEAGATRSLLWRWRGVLEGGRSLWAAAFTWLRAGPDLAPYGLASRVRRHRQREPQRPLRVLRDRGLRGAWRDRSGHGARACGGA